LVRIELRIAGRVQGVGFRWATHKEASRLGLAGWVRNADDGTVEVVAEGSEDVIEHFISWCHSGPPGARVDGVQERRLDASGGLHTFRIRH
jgi:acylphosphatase